MAAVNHHLSAFVPSVEVSWFVLGVVLRVAIVGRERMRMFVSEHVGVHGRSLLHSRVVVVRMLLLEGFYRLVVDSVVVLVVLLHHLVAD